MNLTELPPPLVLADAAAWRDWLRENDARTHEDGDR
jgi:hypothetical protein